VEASSSNGGRSGQRRLAMRWHKCTAAGTGTATGTRRAAKAGKEKEETCRISGMVVKLADGTPLKGATVVLRNDEDLEHTIAAKTTADGRFALKNVPRAWGCSGTG
jgi:hypothetical protein